METQLLETPAKAPALWRRVEIGKRELQLFRFLLEMRFATAEQIWRRYYATGRFPRELATYPWKWVEKRLRKLKWAGFIQTDKSHSYPHQLYFATYRAKSRLEREGIACAGLSVLPGVDFKTFEHDLALVDLRLALELKGFTWYSERELKASHKSGPLPDAAITKGNERMAVEMELSQKRKERYLALFEEYSASTWGRVLYFTGSDSLAAYLKQIAGNLLGAKIYAGKLPASGAQNAALVLKNYQGREVLL